jgi:hypothetical protein
LKIKVLQHHYSIEGSNEEEQNIKTWPAKKPNIKKTLMGGRSAIDMHGAWHPI